MIDWFTFVVVFHLLGERNLEVFMGKKLYVGGISYNTSDDGLHALFSSVGTVESAKIVIDRETSRSKGFGFVEMATEAEAQAAIQKLNGSEADGRRLTVNEARPQAPRENRGGGGGGGRGGRW
jgi:RNA recognition motif-containing protein